MRLLHRLLSATLLALALGACGEPAGNTRNLPALDTPTQVARPVSGAPAPATPGTPLPLATPASSASAASPTPCPPGMVPNRPPTPPGPPQSQPPVSTVGVAPCIAAAAVSYTIPTPNAEQREQISALALAEPRVARLLQSSSVPGLTPQVTKVTPLTSGTTLVGGVAELALGQATTLEGEWPGIASPCRRGGEQPATPVHTPTLYRARYSNVTTLDVFVDVNTGQVIGISPGIGAQLEGEPVWLSDPSTRPQPCGD